MGKKDILVGENYQSPTHLINHYPQNACCCKFGLIIKTLLYPCDHKSFVRPKIQLKTSREYLNIHS